MREQIRLWFYSQLFMCVALVGKAPYKEILAYEKLRDETGKAMHKSWGNAIEVERGHGQDGRRRDAVACTATTSRSRT